jgi:hypothetical protein
MGSARGLGGLGLALGRSASEMAARGRRPGANSVPAPAAMAASPVKTETNFLV